MTNPQAAGAGRAAPPDPDVAWAAVLARDARFDGRFVYAVATTGVYCRPTCPARRPLRRNVAFFASPGGAEAAGYRECRRCRPGGAGAPAGARAVARAREYLDAHLDERVTLERLARAAHLSPHHLQRTFKRLVGVSPRAYQQARRAERLRASLRAGHAVSRAAHEAGYGSSGQAYSPEARLGMSPGAYRRGGAGERIRFGIAGSTLGRLLVAATGRGVCAVTLGDDDAALEADLCREYPRALVERADDALAGHLATVARLLDGPSPALDLPLDVQATAFQWRVWQALREIPYGDTRSYREVARSIGAPTAARAVARACASNRVALVIPCHRVVRGDGELGGYRWGVERKRELLDSEQRKVQSEK